jgi:hypothetical protein
MGWVTGCGIEICGALQWPLASLLTPHFSLSGSARAARRYCAAWHPGMFTRTAERCLGGSPLALLASARIARLLGPELGRSRTALALPSHPRGASTRPALTSGPQGSARARWHRSAAWHPGVLIRTAEGGRGESPIPSGNSRRLRGGIWAQGVASTAVRVGAAPGGVRSDRGAMGGAGDPVHGSRPHGMGQPAPVGALLAAPLRGAGGPGASGPSRPGQAIRGAEGRWARPSGAPGAGRARPSGAPGAGRTRPSGAPGAGRARPSGAPEAARSRGRQGRHETSHPRGAGTRPALTGGSQRTVSRVTAGSAAAPAGRGCASGQPALASAAADPGAPWADRAEAPP